MILFCLYVLLQPKIEAKLERKERRIRIITKHTYLVSKYDSKR